jgi:hypothetical protein
VIENAGVPAALRHVVEQIAAFTDLFCAEGLDAEYAALCRQLIAKLARKRPFRVQPSRLLQRNRLVWLVEVNGIPVDARWLPPELQAEARRRGLIPDLPSTEAA